MAAAGNQQGEDASQSGQNPDLTLPNTSVLSLITQQQTSGQPGLRLKFSPALLQNLTLFQHTYFYSAAGNRLCLAAYLWDKGVLVPAGMPVVDFLGDGAAGNTRWQKRVAVMPSDVACLASNQQLVGVLRNIEAGVPLRWNRINHKQFPADFRKQAALVLQACMPMLVKLPGSARTLIIDDSMQMLAATTVWPALPEAVWHSKWEECLTEEELTAVKELLNSGKMKPQPPNAQMAEYQFQVRAAAAPRRSRVLPAIAKRMIVGGLAGLIGGFAEGQFSPYEAAAGFIMGVAQPIMIVPLFLITVCSRLDKHEKGKARMIHNLKPQRA